jgi:energy-coupling factor transport system ATP-binding protein
MNISINNLNFKYKDKIIFKNFNLEIKENTITTIIGKNGSGKSTLIKMLVGLLPNGNKIKYNEDILNKKNLRKIMKKVGVVFENPDNQFVGQTVMEDLVFTLENMGYGKKRIKKKLDETIEKFNLSEIINESPNNLNNNQKQLVSLAAALIHDPKVLILDEALTYVDPYEKDKILKLLLELKESGLTIIYVTHDIEDTLISDEIVLISDKKVILKGSCKEVYKEEKILNNLGFKLPFMVELSNRLQFYNLIDETIYDMQKMVDTLWK